MEEQEIEVPVELEETEETEDEVEVLYDRLLVERIPLDSVRASGLIAIPETAQEKPNEGVVLKTGNGRLSNGQLLPLQVRVGDHVFFGSFNGVELTVGGKEMLVLREDEILCLTRKK